MVDFKMRSRSAIDARFRADPSQKSGAQRFVQDLQAASLEFIGTAFFLLLGLGGIQACSGPGNFTSSNISKNMYIATSMGLSLLVSAWLFFRITGGLFNPNVSLALFLCGSASPTRFVLYCIAQIAGGIAAAGLLLALLPGPLASNTTLAEGVNTAQGVFIEMFITAALCLSVLMLAAEKHQATPFAPVGVGLTLFACHLFAVPFTGAGMNSARSFGPAVVSGFPFHRHWVYWVGPALGSFLAAGLYGVFKYFRYWRLNPDQDSTKPRSLPDLAAPPSEIAPDGGVRVTSTDERDVEAALAPGAVEGTRRV